jgi:hypothetical protein
MKTIIAGSRRIKTDQELVWLVADAVLKSGFPITEVVSGGARGIDLAGEAWAWANNPPTPIKQFIPNWSLFGKAAGIFRNRDMANYAEALIAIWDGSSRGTKNMIEEANKLGLKIYVYRV